MRMEAEPSPEFVDLLELYLEGNLDDAGEERLAEMIRQDPSLRAVLQSHLDVSSAMGRIAGDDDHFVKTTAEHVSKISNEGEFDFARRVKNRLIRRRISKITAIAAVLTLAALPLVLWKRKPHAQEVATLVRVSSEGATSAVPVFAGHTVEESTGLVRLDFKNGAVTAIEAPLKVKVVSGTEIILESGRLNGWCPDSAHGFRVLTSTAALTDLGTSFGVSVENGKSEFVVLDGMVEVQKAGESVRLIQGGALEAGDDAMKTVTFDASGFRNTWPLSNGILATQGAVIPADPDVPEKLRMMEDNDNVLVIPERRNIPFVLPIKAQLTGPGTLPGTFDGRTHQLSPQAGKRLSSFLIRYNPVGITTEENFFKFEGEVTFDRPVLAIVGSRESLEQTDIAFALGDWSSQYRGIELNQRLNPPDSVTLSEDRRNVKVTFYAGASTDEVRVILEDN